VNQIFISYRHVPPDEQLAERLCAYLQERGLRVFLDKQIRVGRDWVEEIDRQLRASDFFVVFLSEDSILSDMVRQEVQTAHELRQEGKLSIFPVRLGFEGKLPYDLGSYLNRLQYARWNPGDAEAELFALLHAAITDGAALPVTPVNEDTAVISLKDLSAAAEWRGAPPWPLAQAVVCSSWQQTTGYIPTRRKTRRFDSKAANCSVAFGRVDFVSPLTARAASR
jgi:hypothetical protein